MLHPVHFLFHLHYFPLFIHYFAYSMKKIAFCLSNLYACSKFLWFKLENFLAYVHFYKRLFFIYSSLLNLFAEKKCCCCFGYNRLFTTNFAQFIMYVYTYVCILTENPTLVIIFVLYFARIAYFLICVPAGKFAKQLQHGEILKVCCVAVVVFFSCISCFLI